MSHAPNNVKSYGRYALEGFPHSGWKIVSCHERLIPVRCQACQRSYPRKTVYTLRNANWSGDIEVGSTCAEYLLSEVLRTSLPQHIEVSVHDVISSEEMEEIDPWAYLFTPTYRGHVEIVHD